MPTDLDDLRALAITQAKQSGALNEIEKAVSISKLLADERKADYDQQNTRRVFRFTQIQSLLTAATTLISVLGLIATSIYNMGQLSAARSQAETTEWRDFLTSLEKHGQNILQDPTIPFRLRSFSNSPRYTKDARLIAAMIMAKMADADGFQQLFNFVFPTSHDADLNTMLEVARQQNFSFKQAEKQCTDKQNLFKFGDNDYKNICWNGYNQKQVQEFGLRLDDTETWALRNKEIALTNQIWFISAKIGEAFKEKNNTVEANINATALRFYDADFSSVDFVNVDVSDAYFDSVILSKSILNPSKYKGVYFWSSNWWDAQRADNDFLHYLISNMYPRKRWPIVESGNLTQAKYIEAVRELCRRSSMNCDGMTMNFEVDENGGG